MQITTTEEKAEHWLVQEARNMASAGWTPSEVRRSINSMFRGACSLAVRMSDDECKATLIALMEGAAEAEIIVTPTTL